MPTIAGGVIYRSSVMAGRHSPRGGADHSITPISFLIADGRLLASRRPTRGSSRGFRSRPRNQDTFKGFQRFWRPFCVGAFQQCSSKIERERQSSSINAYTKEICTHVPDAHIRRSQRVARSASSARWDANPPGCENNCNTGCAAAREALLRSSSVVRPHAQTAATRDAKRTVRLHQAPPSVCSGSRPPIGQAVMRENHVADGGFLTLKKREKLASEPMRRPADASRCRRIGAIAIVRPPPQYLLPQQKYSSVLGNME